MSEVVTAGAGVHVAGSFEKYGGKGPSSNWRGFTGTFHDAVCIGTRTPVLLLRPPYHAEGRRGLRVRGRPGGVRCVPSMNAPRRPRECVACCSASVASSTAAPPFAGPQTLIIGISQARGAAVSLDASTDMCRPIHSLAPMIIGHARGPRYSPTYTTLRTFYSIYTASSAFRYSLRATRLVLRTELPTAPRVTFCLSHTAARLAIARRIDPPTVNPQGR